MLPVYRKLLLAHARKFIATSNPLSAGFSVDKNDNNI